MAASNPCALAGAAFTPKKGSCGATTSFTVIYDACKSAKGVILNRYSSFTVMAVCTHPMQRKLLKKEGPRHTEALPCSSKQAVIRWSDQRHQLNRHTNDEVTVWMNFSEWTNASGSGTPSARS
jgi:hypothetical protein